MSLTVEIASVPDRDNVVAEIWQGDNMVAEMQRADDGRFVLEIYANRDSNSWAFDLYDWLTVLAEAQKRLT